MSGLAAFVAFLNGAQIAVSGWLVVASSRLLRPRRPVSPPEPSEPASHGLLRASEARRTDPYVLNRRLYPTAKDASDAAFALACLLTSRKPWPQATSALARGRPLDPLGATATLQNGAVVFVTPYLEGLGVGASVIMRDEPEAGVRKPP